MLVYDFLAETKDVVAERFRSLARWIILVVFGLLPLLFVPQSMLSVGSIKIFAVTVGLFIAVIAIAFAILRQGSVRVRFEPTLCLMWGIFFVSAASSFFSLDFFDSFWGTEVTVHSAFFTGLLALTMTVWSALGVERRLVMQLYFLLALSAVALGLYHGARLIFGPEFLSFGTFLSQTVTPFGEWNSLAVFFGLVVILSMIALEQLSLGRMGRVFFAVVVGLSLVMLSVINFIAVFFVLGLVSLIVLLYALTRGKFRISHVMVPHGKESLFSLGVSGVVLLVSIVFIVGGVAVGSKVAAVSGVSYIEVRPSFSATIGVMKQVYQDDALLGVGPNRFIDAWRMYRDPSINATVFWNTPFQSGYGFIPTVFVTSGVVGGLLWIVFLGAFVYVGVRTFVRMSHIDVLWHFILTSSFVSAVYVWCMAVIYVPSPALLLFAALCTGIFLAARVAVVPESARPLAILKSQETAFITVGATVVVVVLAVGGIYLSGRHFSAVSLYAAGLSELQNGGDTQMALSRMRDAHTLSGDSIFMRRIALYYRDEIISVLNAPEGNAQLELRLRTSWEGGVAAARAALARDEQNPENWDTLARVFETIVPLNIEGSVQFADEAENAFERARALDPYNPARMLALANLSAARGDLPRARERVERAIALKPNYTDAIYALAQIQVAEGNVPGAIESTRTATLFDANNPVRHFQLGVLELSLNRNQEALRSFEEAVRLSPDYANARYFLAFAASALGDQDRARNELQIVARLNPDNQEVQALLRRLDTEGTLAEQKQEVSTSSVPAVLDTPSADEPVTSGRAPDVSGISPVNQNTERE